MTSASKAFACLIASVFAVFIGVPQTVAQTETPPHYVGSQACADCHVDETEAWSQSHHGLAWTEPSAETIVADFDGTSFSHDGMTSQFRTQDGGFFVTVTENDGVTTDYRVHSVAGIAPLQQYLLETDTGRIQSFDVVWDVENRRWFHLYPDQKLPPDDGLHWTGPYKTWNARCAECHATGYQRNFSARSQTYRSTQVEFGVGCEACHGPASAHLDWAAEKSAPTSDATISPYGFSLQFGAGNTQSEIETCAGCHARRENFGDGNPVPGTPFHDSYALALLRPGLYHSDGQILDEVYVYGSFLQSKMYAQGVGCLNCHDAHSATLKAEGNAVCTQCHSTAGNPDFPTLPLAEFDTPAHHFHPTDSAGAQCKSCHMVERTYMGVDERSDHSFRIPRPDLGAQTGAPDACTDCHAGQTQDWAAKQIQAWFPDSTKRGAHYGQTLALGRRDPVSAVGSLQELAMDTGQPGIVRATALYLMQPAAGPQQADQTAPLLADTDPLVRASAVPLQQSVPVEVRIERLMPLLNDPMQSVRIAAARHMLDVPPDMLGRSQAAILKQAMGDWRRSISNKLDFPETHLVLGGMALTGRNFPAAMAAFGEVVKLDPQRVEAWSILVRLTHATQGPQAAREVLRAALQRVPGDPGLKLLQSELGG